MIRSLALAACLSAAASGALAADLPTGPAPDMLVAPPTSWTGFYLGASLGASVNSLKVVGEGYDSDVGGFATFEGYISDKTKSSNTSLLASLAAGYNWQYGNYVLGFEMDISRAYSRLNANIIGGADPDTISDAADYFGTLRARAGYAVSQNIMIYATGGLSAVRYTGGFTDVPPSANSKTSDTEWGLGWVAGGGIDYRLAQHWFIRGEYLHVSSSSYLVTYDAPEYETYAPSNRLEQDTFKGGIFYHF